MEKKDEYAPQRDMNNRAENKTTQYRTGKESPDDLSKPPNMTKDYGLGDFPQTTYAFTDQEPYEKNLQIGTVTINNITLNINDENTEFDLHNHPNNIPFLKAGTDISKLNRSAMQNSNKYNKSRGFEDFKKEWSLDKIVSLECLNFVVRTMLKHERIAEKVKSNMQEKKQLHTNQGLMENRGRFLFWLKFQNMWKDHKVTYYSEQMNEAESIVNIFDIVLESIRDREN